MGTRGGRAPGRGKPPQLRSLTPRTLPGPNPPLRADDTGAVSRKSIALASQPPFRTTLSLSLSHRRGIGAFPPSPLSALISSLSLVRLRFPLFLALLLFPSSYRRAYVRSLFFSRFLSFSFSLSVRLSSGTPWIFKVFHGNN